MARPAVMSVTEPKRWRVLLSPIRFELVEAMRSIAPCGVADLADQVGRPADVLYRHVRALERAGFVAPAGYRKVGRHVEQLFDLTADDFRLAAPDAVVPTLRSIARSVDKVVRDADAAGAIDPSDTVDHGFRLLYELAWLTPAELAAVLGHVRQLKAVTDDRRPRSDGKLYAVHVVVSPVVRPRLADGGSADPPAADDE